MTTLAYPHRSAYSSHRRDAFVRAAARSRIKVLDPVLLAVAFVVAVVLVVAVSYSLQRGPFDNSVTPRATAASQHLGGAPPGMWTPASGGPIR
jgi:hypothetical protein